MVQFQAETLLDPYLELCLNDGSSFDSKLILLVTAQVRIRGLGSSSDQKTEFQFQNWFRFRSYFFKFLFFCIK